MFGRLANSWELVKSSAKVLAADKELLIFPIISSIGVLVVSAAFIIPSIFANLFDSLFTGDFQVVGFVVLFLFYVVQYTVIFYMNTALVGAALIRLRGGDPTVKDGFRIASKHFGPIVGYALIAATVGVILKSISDRSKGLGRFVVDLIGLAWNLATFLVVPVLAVEDVGPLDAIKRSVELLKRTWGEQIAGNIGLGSIFALLFIGLGLSGTALIFFAISVLESAVMAVVIGAGLVLVFLLLGLVNSTLSGIYTAAVYQYAVSGQSDGFFEPELVENAFRPV